MQVMSDPALPSILSTFKIAQDEISCSVHDRAQDEVVMGLCGPGPARCAAVVGWTPSGHVAR